MLIVAQLWLWRKFCSALHVYLYKTALFVQPGAGLHVEAQKLSLMVTSCHLNNKFLLLVCIILILHLILTIAHVIERFSNECRKTKTKVITPANHNKHKLSNEPIRTRSKYM